MTRPPEGTGPAEGPVPATPLGLWEGFGVEIELMTVDAATLDVRPLADRLFQAMGGGPDEEIEDDGIGWSNELALHVVELKTAGPASGLEGLANRFQGAVDRTNRVLESMGCTLLPGGVHPWMDPTSEFRIWPHEYTDVYRTFHRIFSCHGHGWANLQSTHVNLPFSGDREFGLLHEAIRLVLPLLPTLAASSPILEGRVASALDSRLLAYRDNARRVPSVTGLVIPEPVSTEREYRDRILEPIYRDLEPLDPEAILRHEWVNARGSIARFERGAVEIRILDAQECPLADLAVVGAVVAAVRRAAAVLEATDGPTPSVSTERLAGLLDAAVHRGGQAPTGGVPYRAILGLPRTVEDLSDVWRALVEVERAERGPLVGPREDEALDVILDEGCLSRRILDDLGVEPEPGLEVAPARLASTYRRLADCLATGCLFRAS